MAISEEARYALHRALEDHIGREHANTLMEHLPPVGWADVATKRDLDGSVLLLRTELKGDMEALRTELKGDMSALRTELKGDMEALESRLETTLHRELRQQLYAIIAVLAALVSTALALQSVVA